MGGMKVVKLRSGQTWLERCLESETGKPLPVVANALEALRGDEKIRDAFAFDQMARVPVLAHPIGDVFGMGGFEPRVATDNDIVDLQNYLQRAGLLRMMHRKFELSTGNRLATMAKPCIRGAMLDLVKSAARTDMKKVPKKTWVSFGSYVEAVAAGSGDHDYDAEAGIISEVPTGKSDYPIAADRFGRERAFVQSIEARILKGLGVKVSRHDLPFSLERLAEEQDRRFARYVVGRRRAAIELVEREQRRIARRAEPTQYLYPWARAQQTTAWNARLDQMAPTARNEVLRERLAILFRSQMNKPNDADMEALFRSIVGAYQGTPASANRQRIADLQQKEQRGVLAKREHRRADRGKLDAVAANVNRIRVGANAIGRVRRPDLYVVRRNRLTMKGEAHGSQRVGAAG